MKTSIKSDLPKIKENVSLADYCTYKIGGRARYFFEAENEPDLIEAVKAAKKHKATIFVLAGGSNVLFSDKGYKGLIVKMKNKGLEINRGLICGQTGTDLSQLVNFSSENKLSGIEWAAGIPGTLGGAVFGNAQAFGERISDNIAYVEALDLKTMTKVRLSKKQCEFKSKGSIFKKKGNLIIISACLKLKKAQKDEILAKVRENLDYRKRNHPLKYPSAGSVFVNPEAKVKNRKLLKEFPELKDFNQKGFIHAGYLIDKCGLKGKKQNKAQISDQHANFIVNLGGAKAKDVKYLVDLAKKAVFKKFRIKLEEEIRIIGEK